MAYPHFQPAQSNSLRLLNKRHAMQLESSRGAHSKRRIKSWWSNVMEMTQRFASRTTIHGLSRLLNDSSGPFERVMWLFTIVLALMGAIYVCLILSDRFYQARLETVIETTRRPVYEVPFPAITICNQNHLNWQRLEKAKEKFLPNEQSAAVLEVFEQVIGAYDSLSFANFNAFAQLKNKKLAVVNNVNFSEVFKFMTWRCEEFLAECTWRHLPMNCCEIFSMRRGKNGLCWSFNSLETEEGLRMQSLDPKWPWRVGSSGPTSGLMARVFINPKKHYPKRKNEKGLMVMITEQKVWHKDPSEIPENTLTIVQFEPVIYFYGNDTRAITSEQRQCVFQDERSSEDYRTLQGYDYMIENCQSQCHQEYLVRYCNCTMDLLFPPGPYRSCRATDLPCLSEHNDIFLYSNQPGEENFVKNHFPGMKCKCFRNCYSLNFFTDIRPRYLPSDVRGNVSYVDLDIHYRYDSLMVYRTSLVFSWIDLMVAFGGIAGLFLGCSLISGVELLYFLCIEIPAFVVQKLIEHLKRRQDVTRTATQEKFGISNRMLAAERHNQGQYVIKSSPKVAIMRVEPNPSKDMHWMMPQKINRQLIQVNE